MRSSPLGGARWGQRDRLEPTAAETDCFQNCVGRGLGRFQPAEGQVHVGQKHGLTKAVKRALRRRAVIEPVIGISKSTIARQPSNSTKPIITVYFITP